MRAPIGEMSEVIAVLVPTTSKDESGGEVTSYDPSDPVFVAIRPVSSTEQLRFGQINAEVTHVLFGHWQELHTVTADCKIRDMETLDEYEVTGPPMKDRKKSWVRLNLVQRENA